MGNMYFGGIPTDIDIRKIRDRYPEMELKTGSIIPYGDIAKLIGVEVSSHRFKTVTNRWRKLVERETGHIMIGVEPGKGFKVMSESEKASEARSKQRGAIKAARRGLVISARVDVKQLSENERKLFDHSIVMQSKIVSIGQVRRQIALPSVEDV
jgi:hypothetical protein